MLDVTKYLPKLNKKFTPKFKGDPNPRQNILELGQKITSRKFTKITVDDAEYWGLAPVCTDEMCEILLKMDVRHPYTMPELIKLTGKDEKYLEDIFQKMGVIGLIEYNWENEKREKQYVLPLFVPGIAEFTNMNPKQLETHPELSTFFERMACEPLAPITPFIPLGGAGIGMHVIPVEKAIEHENSAVPVEKISHWIEKYDGQFAAGACSCRVSRRFQDEGVPDDENDWCIGVGDMADYVVQTNKGRYITKEEALAIIEKAEKNGFVHQITNIDGENKIFAICNCNPKVCYAIRTSQLFNTPNLSRSAYVAHVDKEKCVACGKCVEVCPAGALKLGQKLCTKFGEIKYPKQVLPDRVKWGPEKWNLNYRDTNQENCHDTGTSPCKTACPAHIAVQGYLKLASQGKFEEALALIKQDNPFPAICGRICNRKCEDACTRGTIDQAVAIDAVKKYVADLDLHKETRYVPEKVVARVQGDFSDDKVAIIGAGPAGLSCAYYLALDGYKPVVFEKHAQPGGMLTYGVPSYKLEKDVINAEVDILRELGVEIRCGVEVGKDITIQELREQGFKGFYLAIGLSQGSVIKVPGYEGEGVRTAIEILEEQQNGTLKVNGNVVVIGGGNVAIDAARTSIRLTDGTVTMVSLETRDIMPASEAEILEATDENVQLKPGWGLKEIIRNEEGKITAVKLVKCTRVFDENHRFSPAYDENTVEEIPADEVIFSIGQKPVYKDILKGTKVEIRPNGLVDANEVTLQTAEPDIFAGGDLVSGPSFAINAVASGREGAVSLHRFIQNHGNLTLARNLRKFSSLDKENIVVDSYDEAGRWEEKMDPNIDYRRSFKDAHLTMTKEEVLKETKRCLGCGVTISDPNRCIGCGLCTTRCKFDAIHLERDNPHGADMVKAEDQMSLIMPYMLKRQMNIMFGKKTPEEKAACKEHDEWVKEQKRKIKLEKKGK